MRYSQGFKARMVQRLLGPEGISANALAKEVGVSQGTLSRWLRLARTVPAMGGTEDNQDSETSGPRRWTAEKKFQVLAATAQLSEEELGAYLRREGLHMAQLKEWRAAVEGALTSKKKGKKPRQSPESKKIKQLERELNRKEKALAEAAALLVLQKKAREIWGDGDDDTTTKSGT